MARAVEFTIPGRPIPWARTGGGKGARQSGPSTRFTPEKQREAMRALGLTWKALRERKLSGPLKLEILCVYAIPAGWPRVKREAAQRGMVWHTAKPDWDNLGKLVSDALNQVAFDDDSQIAMCTVAKRHGSPERTVIRLTELKPWEVAAAEAGLPGLQPRLGL